MPASRFCDGVDLNCGCPQRWGQTARFGVHLVGATRIDPRFGQAVSEFNPETVHGQRENEVTKRLEVKTMCLSTPDSR
jgi:hypothetical protein